MLKRMLDRPVTVTMALIVILVLGITSIRMLPISLIPDIDIPYITVQVTAPGLSAREIDETVSKPLRQQLIQINSLEDIRSESRDGSAAIHLAFTQGADIDYLFIEVNEKIDRTMGQLRDIERPRVLKAGAGDIPAFYINMTLKDEKPLPGNIDRDLYSVSDEFSRMSRFAEEVVSKRIEQMDEVAMVDLSGCVDQEILVLPDMKALHRLGITEREFENLISSANIRLGSLSIRDGEYRYSVKFQSFASDKEDIENIYLNSDGRILQVKDIARVIEHPAGRTGLARSDGKAAVTMAVIKQSDARMADLKRSIERQLGWFENDYPEIEFEVTRDQTELLEYSINNLIGNIIAGVILACVIIFLFMRDFRSPALVAFTIPAALVFSMLIFYLIGLTINIISLSGLILGVGMMVDNTIILTDNITARWQRGDSLRDAVLKGTAEVTGAMLSSVLTTCAVFIPLIFVSGIAGAMFYDQAMAVSVVLLTSYVVTVTVIPVYYWCWYRKLDSFRPNSFLERISLDRAVALYENGLVWFLRHRWAGWLIFGISAVGIVACFAFMPKERLPEITYTDTILKVDWNGQVSVGENESRTAWLEKLAENYAVQMTSLVGAQQFVLSHSGEQSVSETSVYIKCRNAADLGKVKKVLSDNIGERYPSSVFGFANSGNIFDMVFADREAPLVARLRPVYSSEVEPEALSHVVDRLVTGLPDAGIQKIPMKTDVLYVADPEKMALYNISYSELVSVLKNALNANGLFNIVQGDRTLPVVMGSDIRDLGKVIQETSVRKDGLEIPLSSLMVQSYESDLKSVIAGAEGSYYPVGMYVDGRDVRKTMSEVRNIVSDDGRFDAGFSGSWFSNRQMINELIIVLAIALVLLYLILASQFESLVQPLVILSEIVMDIFGALAVLWLCGVSINLMSMIGLVVICGIVINDSILKIDTINRLRKSGYRLRHAIMEAGQRRLKAIMMTSLTTILSVCPFLARGSMGDDLQYPMSLVIIAGMVVGTTVSLLFVPMVYYEIYRHTEAKE